MQDKWVKVVKKDHDLESNAEHANEELAKLRWHWTLNKDNPDRVSFSEYARVVGRSISTIRIQANGYQRWMALGQATSLSEQTDRANMSANRAYVVDAIAKAYNVTFTSARESHYQKLVTKISHLARIKAERDGVSFEEVVDEQVAFHVQAAAARERERETLRQNHGIRFVGIENELTRACNAVHKAIQEAHEVDWTDQERTIIADSIRKLSSLTQLLDVAVTGSAKVDWDAELAKLGVA